MDLKTIKINQLKKRRPLQGNRGYLCRIGKKKYLNFMTSKGREIYKRFDARMILGWRDPIFEDIFDLLHENQFSRNEKDLELMYYYMSRVRGRMLSNMREYDLLYFANSIDFRVLQNNWVTFKSESKGKIVDAFSDADLFTRNQYTIMDIFEIHLLEMDNLMDVFAAYKDVLNDPERKRHCIDQAQEGGLIDLWPCKCAHCKYMVHSEYNYESMLRILNNCEGQSPEYMWVMDMIGTMITKMQFDLDNAKHVGQRLKTLIDYLALVDFGFDIEMSYEDVYISEKRFLLEFIKGTPRTFKRDTILDMIYGKDVEEVLKFQMNPYKAFQVKDEKPQVTQKEKDALISLMHMKQLQEEYERQKRIKEREKRLGFQMSTSKDPLMEIVSVLQAEHDKQIEFQALFPSHVDITHKLSKETMVYLEQLVSNVNSNFKQSLNAVNSNVKNCVLMISAAFLAFALVYLLSHLGLVKSFIVMSVIVIVRFLFPSFGTYFDEIQIDEIGEEVKAQGNFGKTSIFTGIGKLFVDVFQNPLQGVIDLWQSKNVDLVIRRISYLGDQKVTDGIEKFKEWFSDSILTIKKWIYCDLLGCSVPDEFVRDKNPVENWIVEVEMWIEKKNNNKIVLETTTMTNLTQLFKVGNRFLSSKLYRGYHSMIRSYLIELSRLIEKCNSKVVSPGTIRKPPAVLYMFGETGIGKSTLTVPLSVMLLKKILERENPQELKRLKTTWQNHIYTRASEQEFWDGYNGQLICQFDDIGQRVDTASAPNLELFEIIRSSNIFAYPLHMAALEDKADTYFTSKVIIASGNFKTIRTESLNYPQALYRRFMVCAEVKRRFKSDVFDPKDYSFDLYTMNNEAEKKILKTVDFDGLIEELMKCYEKSGVSLNGVSDWINAQLGESVDKGEPMEVSTTSTNTLDRSAPDSFGIAEDYMMDQKAVFKDGKVEFQANAKKKRSAWKMYAELIGVLIPVTVMPYLGAICYEKYQTSDDPLNAIKNYILKNFRSLMQFGSRNFKSSEKMTIKKYKEQIIAGKGENFEEFLAFFQDKYHGRPIKFVNALQATEFHLWQAAAFEVVEEIYAKYGIKFDKGDGEPEWKTIEEVVSAMSKDNKMHLNDLVIYMKLVGVDRGNNVFSRFWFNVKQQYSRLNNFFKWTGAIVGIAGLISITYSMYQSFTKKNDYSSHLKKMKAQNAMYKELISASTDENLKEKAQINDLNSEEILTSTVKRNLYKMMFESKTCEELNGIRFGHCVFLKGKLCIMSGHFKFYMDEYIKKDPDLKIVFFSIGGLKKFDVFLKDLKFEYYESSNEKNAITRDIIHTVVPTTYAHADLTPQFIELKDVNNVQVVDVKLPVLREGYTQTPTLTVIHAQSTHCASRTDDTPIAIDLECENQKVPVKVKAGWRYSLNTQMGDCGAPLIIQNQRIGPGKICGIHSMGGNNLSYSVMVTREDVVKIINKTIPQICVVQRPESCHKEIFEQKRQDIQIETIGEITNPVFQPMRTKIQKSLLHGEWKEATTKPCLLRPTMIDGEEFDPREYRLKKLGAFQTCIKMEQVERAKEVVSSFMCNQILKRKNELSVNVKKDYTYEEAVTGIDGENYINSLKRTTSCGFPFQQKGLNRFKLWGKEDQYKFGSEDDIEMKRRVDEILSGAKEGTAYSHVFTATLKDERKSIEKSHKTRLFYAGPIDYLIACKMKMQGIVSAIEQTRNDNGISIGTNVYSSDWHFMIMRLKEKSNKFGAGDYEAFDASQHREVLEAAFEVFIKIGDMLFGYSEEDKLVLRTLGEGLLSTYMILGKDIYRWVHSLPSGHFLTSILNSIYTHMTFILCFDICLKERNEGKNVNIMELSKFYECGALVAYGDDHIVAFPEFAIKWFNEMTVPEFMKQIGVGYTMETKTGKAEAPFRSLYDISYLKRKIRYASAINRYVAPLDLDVILEIPFWHKSSKDERSQLIANCEKSICELALHEVEVWNEWHEKIDTAMQNKLAHFTKFRNYAAVQLYVIESMEPY